MITTRFYGPTDHEGSRIAAHYRGRQLTVPYDYASTDPHREAAAELVQVAPEALAAVDSSATGYRFDFTSATGCEYCGGQGHDYTRHSEAIREADHAARHQAAMAATDFYGATR